MRENSNITTICNEMQLLANLAMTDYIFHRSSISSIQKDIRNDFRESDKHYIQYSVLMPSTKKTFAEDIEKEKIELMKYNVNFFNSIANSPTGYTTIAIKQYTELSAMVQNQKSGILILGYLIDGITNKISNNGLYPTVLDKKKIFYNESIIFLNQYALTDGIIFRYIANTGIDALYEMWKWCRVSERQLEKLPYKKENKWVYNRGYNSEVTEDRCNYLKDLKEFQLTETENLNWDTLKNSFSTSDFYSMITINDDLLYNNIIQRATEINHLSIKINKLLSTLNSLGIEDDVKLLIEFIEMLIDDLKLSFKEVECAVKYHTCFIEHVMRLHRIVYRLQQIDQEKILLEI